MDTLEEVKSSLAAQEQFKWRIDGNWITVEPSSPDGFSVWITGNGHQWTVGFDGWHQHFDSEFEAVDCFLWGLSGKCRLTVSLRGKFPYKWTAEYEEGGEWRSLGTTALLVFPFWRKKTTEYLQNCAVKIERT
jgi:hypothetical protein